jgi:hypothetical protein
MHMQIRIVIRRVRQSWNVCTRAACQLMGHRNEIEVGSMRLSLKCERCGWTSPGWTLDDRRPSINGSSRPSEGIATTTRDPVLT